MRWWEHLLQANAFANALKEDSMATKHRRRGLRKSQVSWFCDVCGKGFKDKEKAMVCEIGHMHKKAGKHA
jgi:rubrerythrin